MYSPGNVITTNILQPTKQGRIHLNRGNKHTTSHYTVDSIRTIYDVRPGTLLYIGIPIPLIVLYRQSHIIY